MSKELALLLCTAFIIFLQVREQKLRPMTSAGGWVALCWVLIIGSRPVSSWFEGEIDPEKIALSYLEGTPLDRNIFLALLCAGAVVLWRRRVEWGRVLAENRWLFLFFLYCGLSVLWSDHPFVSFKRWGKDLGSLLMVFLILSEEDPFESAKALFARYIYCAVPLSTLLIKYYPQFGRYYSHWSYEPAYCGVATNKNELGIILVICGVFLVQDLVELLGERKRESDRLPLAVPLFLLILTVWLLRIAGSVTAQVCLIMGVALLLALRLEGGKSMARHLGAIALVAGVTVFLFYYFPSLTKSLLTMLGRDATFTGRTEIWKDVLSQPINPYLGTGYRSFWLGPAQERLQLNQAHNGYLETYLNGGLLGLAILVAMLLSAGRRFPYLLQFGGDFTAMRFAFFVVAVCYNWTEAMFNGLSLIWFVLLLAAVHWPEQEFGWAPLSPFPEEQEAGEP